MALAYKGWAIFFVVVSIFIRSFAWGEPSPDIKIHSKADSAGSLRTKFSAPPPGEKPTVVILSYGRLNGDSWPQLDFLESLTHCGIEPILLDDISIADLPKKLEALHLEVKPIVLLNAHGESEHADDYRVGSSRSPVKYQNGNSIVRIIEASLNKPRIWLGTCSSGACRAQAACIGAECGPIETAFENRLGWDHVAKLICDGFKGDCSLWREADKNHNGTIDARELNEYLCTKAKAPGKIVYTVHAADLKTLNERRENYRKECQGREGDFRELSAIRYLWDGGFEVRPRTSKPKLEWRDLLSETTKSELAAAHSLSEATAVIEKIFPDFPNSGGEFTLASKKFSLSNGSLSLFAVEQTVSCTIMRPMFCRNVPITNPSLGMYYMPDTKTFELESLRCADQNEAGQTSK